MLDATGLQVLDREECLVLLAKVRVGRIAYIHRALPAIQPVAFVLDGEAVIVPTAPGSELTAATHGTVVAFAVDEINLGEHLSWSVTAVGHAEDVTDEHELHRLTTLAPRHTPGPRPPGERHDFLRISIDLITGHRLPAAGARPPAGQSA